LVQAKFKTHDEKIKTGYLVAKNFEDEKVLGKQQLIDFSYKLVLEI